MHFLLFSGLLHLLRKAKFFFSYTVKLLILIDCIAFLMILKKWGRSDFSDPREVIHFNVNIYIYIYIYIYTAQTPAGNRLPELRFSSPSWLAAGRRNKMGIAQL
jgi:hypothetical protein